MKFKIVSSVLNLVPLGVKELNPLALPNTALLIYVLFAVDRIVKIVLLCEFFVT